MTAALRSALVVGAAIGVDLLFWDRATTLITGDELPLWLPVVATVTVHQSLWWRMRRPVLVLAIQWAFALVSLAVPLWQPCVGFLVALYFVARSAAGNAPLAVVPIPLLAHSMATARAASAPVTTMVALSVLWLGAAGATWAAGRAARARSARLSNWQREQDRRQDEAVEAERVQLARELHDGVANTITAVLLQAAAARHADRQDPDTLAGIETAARRAMTEIQAMLQLMPRTTNPLAGPTLADLPDLLALARSAGLDVRTTTRGTPRPLDGAVERAAYRAIQEGITNALKHADEGATCEVDLRWTDQELLISVTDAALVPPPGRVATPPAAGLESLPATGGRGLAGRADRLRPLGGWVQSGAHGSGFRLMAGLPLPTSP